MQESSRTGRAPLLSVVFSFRNEEANLPELIRRVRAVLAAERAAGGVRGHELVFVDDASTDRSPEILREHAAEGDVRVVTMSRPFGASPCALAGMRYASGDLVVYMDSDLQDPPELIPELLRAWREDPEVDVVHTVRRSRAGEPRLKLRVTALGYWILGRASDSQIPRDAGDFKLLSRRVVERLLEMREHNPFLRGLVCWVGFKQVFVPYDRQARAAGRSQFPVFGRKVIFNFLDSALISFSTLPLKFALLLGACVSASAFVLLVWIVAQKIVLPYVTPGVSAIMVTTLFLGGVQLLTIGILGLYVSSIFLEVKARPSYIVRDTFGFPEKP